MEDGLKIIKASYGVETQFVDVTKEIQGLNNNGELNFIVSAQSLGILDPNPGSPKILQIQYKVNNGHTNLEKFNDGEQVKLSIPTIKVKKHNHILSVSKYAMMSAWIILLGFFIIDSYKSGNALFPESTYIGLAFGLLSFITFGYIGWFWILLCLIIYNVFKNL